MALTQKKKINSDSFEAYIQLKLWSRYSNLFQEQLAECEILEAVNEDVETRVNAEKESREGRDNFTPIDSKTKY